VNPAAAEREPDHSRVLTIPNLITFARLAGVPLFLYLFLVRHEVAASVAVLVVGGTTDWVDGYLARRMRQVSRLGELLDPAADRLYIATVLALTIRNVVPWQFTAALLARELVMGGCLLVLRRNGYGPPRVHYLGKTATFMLLCAFPTLLLAKASASVAEVANICGWAIAWWGIALYWIAAGLYLAQARGVVRASKHAAATQGETQSPGQVEPGHVGASG
jgi:cardiolipin synthase